jgi:uncharacterized membrane protein
VTSLEGGGGSGFSTAFVMMIVLPFNIGKKKRLVHGGDPSWSAKMVIVYILIDIITRRLTLKRPRVL